MQWRSVRLRVTSDATTDAQSWMPWIEGEAVMAKSEGVERTKAMLPAE